MTTSNAKNYATKTVQRFREQWEDDTWSFGTLFAIACFSALIAMLIKLVFTNVEPFIYLVGGEYPKPSGIPIIGWAWDLINLFYTAFGATVAWAIVNACETAWIFIALDKNAHRSAIRQAQEELNAYGPDQNDNSYTRKLKRKGLKIPFFFIEFSPIIALAGLTIDVIVNWHQFPVITSWSKFWGGLLIGRVMGVDWSHLKSIAWNLTSLEILVILLIVTYQWIQAHRSA